MTYILNTNSGILHTKACGDKSIGAGHRQHYSSYENAIKDESYEHDHLVCIKQ